MNNQERINIYIQKHYSKYKNKFDCEIKVSQNGDTIYTRCGAYERKD